MAARSEFSRRLVRIAFIGEPQTSFWVNSEDGSTRSDKRHRGVEEIIVGENRLGDSLAEHRGMAVSGRGVPWTAGRWKGRVVCEPRFILVKHL